MTNRHVLHCFVNYLPVTQNWAFRLIQNTPNFDISVAANNFQECGFYHTGTKYYFGPWSRIGSKLPWIRKLSHFADSILFPFYVAWLRRSLRNQRIDVVHCHFADTGWRYRKLARDLGAALVVSFYGWDYEHLPTVRPRWWPRIRQIFEDANILVCEGTHGAKLLGYMGCDKAKIRVCRLGIEPGQITYRKRRKEPGQLELLQVASFRAKKGHSDTIRAFARALPNCPGAMLTLVGSGDSAVLEDVRAVIAAEGIQDSVHILEQIDFARLHDFMSDYDVFIHPSVHTPLNDCEGGAPIVLLDAQATGMPVVSTLHCDIPEEVIDESTGLLVAEHDIDALSHAIERFYAMEQSEYDGFCMRARAHVVEQYDVRDCGKEIAGIYRAAIQSSRAHAT